MYRAISIYNKGRQNGYGRLEVRGGSLFAPSETCPDRQRDVRMDEEEAGTTRIRAFAGWYGCMCVPGRAGAVRKVEKGQRVGETTCREHPPAASKRDGIVE